MHIVLLLSSCDIIVPGDTLSCPNHKRIKKKKICLKKPVLLEYLTPIIPFVPYLSTCSSPFGG